MNKHMLVNKFQSSIGSTNLNHNDKFVGYIGNKIADSFDSVIVAILQIQMSISRIIYYELIVLQLYHLSSPHFLSTLII